MNMNSLYIIYIISADIDECSVENGGCDQRCENTLGSYQCVCDEGFNLASNNKMCQGIISPHSTYNETFQGFIPPNPINIQ